MHVSFTIAKQSAMLDAHFPGHPIVPGAALLEAVLCALEVTMPATVSVKFLHPVRPGDYVSVQSAALANGPGQKFEARVGSILVCSGQVK
jgi:3-hydroxyacyl-[acyl-carrier-protein] dehydratase